MTDANSESYSELFDQVRLRDLGQKVRVRLADNVKVDTAPIDGIELFGVGDFGSVDECQALIDLIDRMAAPSTLFDFDYSSGFRTSFSANFDPHHTLVKAVSNRIDALLGIDSALGETIQGQRYLPGQEFKAHHDWFHCGTSYWDREMARGGQRSFTAMLYLNDVEEGGETAFPEIDISVVPKRGTLLIWNNATLDGLANTKTLHAGTPVRKGVKYVLTKWYRARPWIMAVT